MPSTRDAYEALYGDDAEEVADSHGADLGGSDDSDDSAGSSSNDSSDSSGGSSSSSDSSSSSGSSSGGSSSDSGGDSGRAARLLDGSAEDTSTSTSNQSSDDEEGIGPSNPLYDAVKSRNEENNTPGMGIKDSAEDDDGGSSSSSSRDVNSSGSLADAISGGDDGTPSNPTGNTPDSPSSPVGQVDDDAGRDPENIEPGPASKPDPTPPQGVETEINTPLGDQAQSLEQEAIDSLESRVGREFTEEDVRVNKTQQDGNTVLEAELTGSGQEQVEFEQFQREFQAERDPSDMGRGPTPDDVAPDTSGGQSQASDAVSAVEEAQANAGGGAGSDAAEDIASSGETGQTATKETAETSTPQTGGGNEVFGGRGDFENRLRAGAETFREELVEPVADTADNLATAGGSALAMGSPVTASDPTKAAASDSNGEGVGSAARGTVQGAGEIANLPQAGVTAIEAGEVGKAFAESSPAVEGGRDGLDEFADDAVLAGERTAGNVAEQATENPAEFGGELLGGAVVGSGAATAARRALGSSSAAGSSVDVETSGGSNLGTGGTGSLLDADALDDAQGVTGPSAKSRARGRLERSDTFQSVRDSFRQFRADESAQLRGRQRQRDTGSNDRVDDRFRGFESEVRRSALEQREFSDFQDLDRGGINDRASRGARTRPEAEASSRLVEPQRRRSRQAQQSEVLDGPAELSAGGGLLGGLLPDGASSAVTQGAQSRLEQAQEVTVTPFQSPGVRSGPGLDVGLGGRQATGPDGDFRTGAEQDFDNGDLFDRFGSGRPRGERESEIGQRLTDSDNAGRLGLGGFGDSSQRPRVPDSDDNNQQNGLGSGLLFGGSESDTESAAGTDFVAETLTGFGEGGLNVEAAQAADSAESGFLSTTAQADGSEGFTAAQELFGVGGEP